MQEVILRDKVAILSVSAKMQTQPVGGRECSPCFSVHIVDNPQVIQLFAGIVVIGRPLEQLNTARQAEDNVRTRIEVKTGEDTFLNIPETVAILPRFALEPRGIPCVAIQRKDFPILRKRCYIALAAFIAAELQRASESTRSNIDEQRRKRASHTVGKADMAATRIQVLHVIRVTRMSPESRSGHGHFRRAPIERDVGSRHPVIINDNEANTAIFIYILFISSP